MVSFKPFSFKYHVKLDHFSCMDLGEKTARYLSVATDHRKDSSDSQLVLFDVLCKFGGDGYHPWGRALVDGRREQKVMKCIDMLMEVKRSLGMLGCKKSRNFVSI